MPYLEGSCYCFSWMVAFLDLSILIPFMLMINTLVSFNQLVKSTAKLTSDLRGVPVQSYSFMHP